MHFHHPGNTPTSLSWQGEAFEPDENGVFDISEAAAADLAAFGIIAGDPALPEPAEVAVPISQWKNDALLAKAAELGLQLPPDIKRPDLIKAVAAAVAPKG
jgi:hypothetical protein